MIDSMMAHYHGLLMYDYQINIQVMIQGSTIFPHDSLTYPHDDPNVVDGHASLAVPSLARPTPPHPVVAAAGGITGRSSARGT